MEIVVVNDDTAEEVVEPVKDDTAQETVKLAFATQVLRECLRQFVNAIQQGEQECLWQSQRFGTPRLVVVVPWNNKKNKNYEKKEFSLIGT